MPLKGSDGHINEKHNQKAKGTIESFCIGILSVFNEGQAYKKRNVGVAAIVDALSTIHIGFILPLTLF